MDIQSVSVRPGAAYMTFEKNGVRLGFSGVWSFDVDASNGTLYEISLYAPGRPDSMAGLKGLFNWTNRDKLLSMIKYEYPSEDIETTTSISLADAKELKGLLVDVGEGRQPVRDRWGGELNAQYRDEVVTFLEPRIEVAAQLLDGDGLITIGQIDTELREQRENPHLPRA